MAATELIRRTDATTSLIAFTEYTFPKYVTTWLHRRVAAALERVALGEVDRLMLLLPPRHGKSELASRRFCAWYLGLYPEHHLISASATADLSGEFGRDVRNICAAMQRRLAARATREGGRLSQRLAQSG